MRILFDATGERMYPIAGQGLTSGTVNMVRGISAGLANRGHTVHIITNDAATEMQLSDRLWHWPKDYHPTVADVAIQLMHLRTDADYDAETLILATFGCDPWLGDNGEYANKVEAYPLLSETHGRIMRGLRPTIPEDRCFVTGLGINISDYPVNNNKIPGRMLYANDPARGLWTVLDIFDLVRKEINDATLHIAYDFDAGLSARQWEHSQMAELLWECKRRILDTPAITNCGAMAREAIIQEELECQVHCMPSDPPNRGTQIWGMTQMECASAGCALVLSDVEAFPEVFGEASIMLPVVGKYVPQIDRRITVDDYASNVIKLMTEPQVFDEYSNLARELAAKNTWETCIDKWEAMLAQVTSKEISVGSA